MRPRITPTCRRLVSASLLLCMSVLGLMPRVMLGQALASFAESRQETQHCCCGTGDGRCCGMACCNTSPISQEKQAPNVPRNSKERGEPIWLSEFGGPELVAAEAARARAYLVEQPVSLNVASLIKLGIRLNV